MDDARIAMADHTLIDLLGDQHHQVRGRYSLENRPASLGVQQPRGMDDVATGEPLLVQQYRPEVHDHP
jgi:hypothetical protein